MPTNKDPAQAALEHLRSGGEVQIRTAWRITRITARNFKRWEARGDRLIWGDKDGVGIRVASGRGSVYCFPHLVFLV